MAVAYVKKSTELFADGASSIAPSLASVVAGNLVVLVLANRGGPGPLNFAPPSGWSDAISPNGTASVTYDANVCIFYKENASSGTQSGTVSLSASDDYASASIVEFSGVATTGALDVTASATTSSTSSTGSTGTTATTAVADSVAVAVLCPANSSGVTSMSAPPATGYTTIETEATDASHLAYTTGYKILTATGTQSASCTTGEANYWASAIAVFKGTGAGGGTTPKGPLGNPFSGPFGGPI